MGALRHPLVAALLGEMRAIGLAHAGLPQTSALQARDLGLDSLTNRGISWPRPRRGNGSARVRRAALKARNRRAHRAKAR